MRAGVILRYVGSVMLYVAAFMGLCTIVSFLNGIDDAFYLMLLSTILTFALGSFPLLFVEKVDSISNKEGFVIVSVSWLVASVVGMFPYLLWGGELSPIDAWFESVSGFTATGASILEDIEALPKGLLFWRTSSCWIGGIGVVMFAIVILPSMGGNRMALSNNEISSLAKDNLRYRAQMIVRILLCVYLSLTILTALLLHLCGMSLFDAVNHAMSACATCGFSTRNLSIGAYNSPLIEFIMMLAMLLSSIHLGVIYATITLKSNNIFRSEVCRTYLITILAFILVITLSLYVGEYYPSSLECLRKASFQVISIISTSGFSTADTNQWPSLAVIILIFCTLMCGCAGSTSGGMKVDRIIVFIKELRYRIICQQHPTAVFRMRLDGYTQDESQMHTVLVFISTYLFTILVASIIGAACGLDLQTAFSSSAACIGNVGPGFGQVGVATTYNTMPVIIKFLNTLLMLMGRLEIFGFIQFLFTKWWR
ncbi:MAG: TrkH family potassium uptake protein [Alistipes sp.]|nr:TrkH family potassium uptake protein [Candidatus Alistipes equi]